LRDRAAWFVGGRFCGTKRRRLQIIFSWGAENVDYVTRLDDLDGVLDAAGDGICITRTYLMRRAIDGDPVSA
jgi:hypothetical protein